MVEPCLHQTFSRNTERASCNGLALYEYRRQYAGTRQCRYADGTESDEGTARTEPEERYGFQFDDYVLGAQYFRTDAYSYQYHGVSCSDGSHTAYRYFHPYFA